MSHCMTRNVKYPNNYPAEVSNMGVVLKGPPYEGKNKNLINFLSVRQRVTVPHQSPQRCRHTHTHTVIISPDSCPDANRNFVTEALRMTQRLLQHGSVSSQLPIPLHSLSSMPLIVLGRGGPFLLTSLVLLFLQGPALRT